MAGSERLPQREPTMSAESDVAVADADVPQPAQVDAAGGLARHRRRRRSPWCRWSGSGPAPTTSTPPAPSRRRSPPPFPLRWPGLSGLWSERAGVVNIGIEGMMILGTFGAGYAGYQWGPWAGVFFGIVCGLLGGLLLGLATITVGVDHIIAGVAINILAPGLALYLSRLVFTDAPGGGQRQSPPVSDVGRITLPWLSDWLGEIEDKGWFFVSDVAGILRGVLHEPVAALGAGRRADRAVRVRAVADQARPAAAVGRRGAVRGGVAGRQRLLVQVHRRDGLRRAGRAGRRVPGGRPEVPGRADRRPRVHRPGRDDLRQLAPRRDGHGRRAVRLHRRRAAVRLVRDRRCMRS